MDISKTKNKFNKNRKRKVKILKNFNKLVFLIGTSLAISSCYHEYNSWTDTGYASKEYAPSLIKVSYTGWFIDQVDKNVLRRAAEIGKEKGKPYFAIYTSLEEAVDNIKAEGPSITEFGGNNYAYVLVNYHDTQEVGDLSVTKILNKDANK